MEVRMDLDGTAPILADDKRNRWHLITGSRDGIAKDLLEVEAVEQHVGGGKKGR